MATHSQILGIKPNASLAAIKKAYRQKAWKLHPDVNPDPHAHDQFIRLNEAYEYLVHRRTGKIYQEEKHSYQRPEPPVKTYAQWKAEEREKARARARKHARMKYEEFKKTNYYRNEIALENLGDNMMFFFLLLASTVPLVIGLITGQYVGVLFGIMFALFGIPLWRGALKAENNIGLSHLFRSLWTLCNTRVFRLILMMGINFYLFFKIVVHTLIPWPVMLILYLGAMVTGRYLVHRHHSIRNNVYNRTFWPYVAFPGILNLFFLLNFLGSHSPEIETYDYRVYQTAYYSRYTHEKSYDPTPVLVLEDQAYEWYPGIRFFWFSDRVQPGRWVEYEFQTGLMGIRVLRSYRFFKKPPG